MRVLIYCQHVWGVGHLFRIREICRKLARHDLILVTGGPKVDVRLPGHVRQFHLPTLQADTSGKLYSDDGRIVSIGSSTFFAGRPPIPF